MSKSLALSLALLATLCLAATAQFSGSQTLNSFDDLTLNLPFRGEVQTSSNGSYNFQWTASQDLTDLLRITRGDDSDDDDDDDDDELVIGFADGTSITNLTASYLITMPADTLQELKLNGAGTVNVSGAVIESDDDNDNDDDDDDDDDDDNNGGVDFDEDFEVKLSGAGTIYLYNVTRVDLEIDNNGAGDVIVAGSPGEIDYDASGAGNLYVYGAIGDIEVDMRGAGSVNIDAASNIEITGESRGAGKVIYNQGRCSVSSNACQQSNTIAQPPSINTQVAG